MKVVRCVILPLWWVILGSNFVIMLLADGISHGILVRILTQLLLGWFDGTNSFQKLQSDIMSSLENSNANCKSHDMCGVGHALQTSQNSIELNPLLLT